MARVRPTSLTVMGILNIVFGSLFLLCYVCNAGSLIMNVVNANNPRGFGGMEDPGLQLWLQMRAEVPGFMPFQVFSVFTNLGLAILLLTAGIGLLNVRGWARVGSIIYSIGTILLQIGALIYQLAFINPVVNRWVRAEFGRMRGPDPGFLVGLINIVTVVVAIVLMIYAVVLLIMMLNPRIAAAFADRRAPSDYAGGGGYDEGEDDYERRPRRDGWND